MNATLLPEFATANVIACLDISFIPLERLFVKKVDQGEYTSVFANIRKIGLSAAYPGVGLNYGRQMVIWSTLLGTNKAIDPIIRELEFFKDHPLLGKVTANFAGAGCLLLVVSPLDFIRTHIQADEKKQQMGALKVAKQFYQEGGVKTFYSGWRFSIINAFMHNFVARIILSDKPASS